MRRLKKELPEKEYGKPEGAMRALRRKNYGLGTDGTEVLSRVFRYSPLLEKAYELCEELTYISDRPVSEKKARKEIGIRAGSVGPDGSDCFKNFPRRRKKERKR